MFYLGEDFLVKGVLELRTEGWVGVHSSESEEDSLGKRNGISKGSEACFVWKGVKSLLDFIIRGWGKSGRGWRRKENKSCKTSEAKLWRLDFIPQAVGRHLRLFGRFAIQDGLSGHDIEGNLKRNKTGNQQ